MQLRGGLRGPLHRGGLPGRRRPGSAADGAHAQGHAEVGRGRGGGGYGELETTVKLLHYVYMYTVYSV